MKLQKTVLDAVKATRKKVDMGYRVIHQDGQLVYNVNRGRINIVQESGAANSNSWFADRTGQVDPTVLVAAVSVIEDTLVFSNGVFLKACQGVTVEI